MRRQATGFTLIEVLVVLVIMGVMATVVSIGVGSLSERADERALERLSRAIEAGAERAMVRGRPLAVEFGAGSCRFLVMNIDGSWQALSEPPLFTEWHLPSGWAWGSLQQDGQLPGKVPRLLFTHEPAEFRLRIGTPQGEAVLLGNSAGNVRIVMPGGREL